MSASTYVVVLLKPLFPGTKVIAGDGSSVYGSCFGCAGGREVDSRHPLNFVPHVVVVK